MQLLYIINKAEKYTFKSGSMVKAKQVTLMQEAMESANSIATLSNCVVYFISGKAHFSIGILRNKKIKYMFFTILKFH